VSNDASVKDMEAAAIAWVAELSNTPFFALKVVTDLVDGEVVTQDEFLANLSTAASTLQVNLLSLISYVVGKPLADL
jgi:nucleoside phosphorylase